LAFKTATFQEYIMAITVISGSSVTLDETSGAQNSGADSQNNEFSLLSGTSLPTAFADALSAVTPVTQSIPSIAGLSGYSTVNSSGTNLYSFGPDVTGIRFTLDGGDGVYSGLRTIDGTKIFLYVYPGDNNVLLGVVGDDNGTADPGDDTPIAPGSPAYPDVAFAVYLEPTLGGASALGDAGANGAKAWVVQYEPLYHNDPGNPDDSVSPLNVINVVVDQFSNFSLEGAPSGQNLFLMFGDGTPTGAATEVSIVVTASNPAAGGTVNTGQGGGGTTIGTNNQMIDPDEGMYFTFVTGANTDYTVPNLDQNEADLESNILFGGVYGATAARFSVVQLQPPKASTLKITALTTAAESGVGYIAGLGDVNNDFSDDATDTDDDVVAINKITITTYTKSGNHYTANTPLVFSASGTQDGRTVTFNTNGTVTIAGIEAKDDVAYETGGLHNRVLIQNVGGSGGNSAFDIGGFSVNTTLQDSVDFTALAFEDDAPTISANAGELNNIVVDETTLATDDDENYSSTFTSAFGADGAGTLVYSLAIAAGNPASGLTDSATNHAVFLFLESGKVVGREGTDAADAADNAIVFEVSINGSTGLVTLDQKRAVMHTPDSGADQATTLAADNLVQVVATITDKDGDQASASQDIGTDLVFEDDAPTVSANNTALLDDDVFTGGNPGGSGDDTNNDLTSGTLGHDFKQDGAGTIAYLTTSAPSGFAYSLNGTSLEVRQGTTLVLTLTLNSTTGAYTVTQNAPILHASGSNENNQPFTINYRVTDKDGDTADGTLAINVDDDTPTLAFGNMVGTGTVVPQYGFWSKSAGADGLGTSGLDMVLSSFQLVKPDNTVVAGSSFTFSELSPSPDGGGAYRFGGSLTGDFDNDAATPDITVNFTLTAYANGQYALDLQQGFSSTVTLSSANGSLDAGGPDPVRTLTIGSEEIVFFAAVPTAPAEGANSIESGILEGVPDLTEAQLQTNPLPPYIGSSAMNVSTSGIGIANNLLQGDNAVAISNADESFVVNPESPVIAVKVYIDNSVAGYDFATEDLYYRVYYTDGSVSSLVEVNAVTAGAKANDPVSFLIQREGTKLIDAVQLIMGRGEIKVPVIEFTKEVETLADDVRLNFAATVTDGDSDTATSNFSTTLTTNELTGATIDFYLAGISGASDAFNVDLSSVKNDYQITGFGAGSVADKLVLLGDLGAGVVIDNTGTDSVVTITETGGQVTTVTLIGVDVLNTDIVAIA
jgi:Domain of unknown function (DUF5801)